MDSILKSLSIGIYLRCLFAGGFFTISYCVATGNPQQLAKIGGEAILTVALPVAFFAGVTAYGLHRSLIFPIIEYCFDTEAVKTFRKQVPLIRKSTIDLCLRRWKRAAEEKAKSDCECAKRITEWADYTHLHYTSVICIALGALVGRIIVPGKHPPCSPLIISAFVLFVAAILSDWRLRSVDDRSYQNDAPTAP